MLYRGDYFKFKPVDKNGVVVKEREENCVVKEVGDALSSLIKYECVSGGHNLYGFSRYRWELVGPPGFVDYEINSEKAQ